MKKPTKIVGITGGIGSGKTTICKIFELLDIPIYYADDRAKELMNSDPEVKKEIISEFGAQAFKGNSLNKPFLSNKVFNDSGEVKKLNAIVHPAVAKDFEQWVEKQNTDYVLKEAALLIESGSYQNLDFLITVYSPKELRIKRIQQRDPFRSKEQIKGIISKQVTESKRQELADYIINNDEAELLIPQVLSLHHQLITPAS